MDFLDDFLFGGYGSSSESLKSQVDTAIHLFERGNIPVLQQKLFEIYSGMNKPGGGIQIVNFDQKDKLGEIFTLCLRFDWMDDSDIREVWAEDGFCLTLAVMELKGFVICLIGMEAELQPYLIWWI